VKTQKQTSRISVCDKRALKVIEDYLAPLYLKFESVNAVAERLKSAAKIEGVPESSVMPMRLHTLLSMDPSRSINSATFENLELALNQLQAKDFLSEKEQIEKIQNQSKDLIAKWLKSDKSLDALLTISAESSMPPAILYCLLKRMTVISDDFGRNPISGVSDSPSIIHSGKIPDWSFQTTAVRKVLKDLLDREKNRVALIIPTGGGKTRTALRVAMNILLSDTSSTRPIIWITHRKNLMSQAYTQLQKIVGEGVEGIPNDSAKVFQARFQFLMVSALKDIDHLRDLNPLLIIIDEAHHAAAPSYDSLFESERFAPVLFLTATPNRPDGKSIRVDKISYSITFRELVKRNVILMPEFLKFPVSDFDWDPVNIQLLARHLIEKSMTEFKKILIIAPTIEKVDLFYYGLLEALREVEEHFLTDDDIGYVHSGGVSQDSTIEDFLKNFETKSRGILISAQMLLEGFDDPSIDTVVLTYPSSSIVVKLQAAGRCVRIGAGKEKAFVLQASNESLAYYFDQKWLYEDISDYLKPEVKHIYYDSLDSLNKKILELLQGHNVHPSLVKKILDQTSSITQSEDLSMMFSGYPFTGNRENFEKESRWSALAVTQQDHNNFITVFNDISCRGAEINMPHSFLKTYDFLLQNDSMERASTWRQFNDLASAMYEAKKEIYEYGAVIYDGKNRPFKKGCATTWLKYYKFYPVENAITAEVDFFSPCFNKDSLLKELLTNRSKYKIGIKIPIPLSGWEGFLLTHEEGKRFLSNLQDLRRILADVDENQRFEKFYQLVMSSHDIKLHSRITHKYDLFIDTLFEKKNLIHLEVKNEF
jgi:superfamily II DNA or RNA helicase